MDPHRPDRRHAPEGTANRKHLRAVLAHERDPSRIVGYTELDFRDLAARIAATPEERSKDQRRVVDVDLITPERNGSEREKQRECDQKRAQFPIARRQPLGDEVHVEANEQRAEPHEHRCHGPSVEGRRPKCHVEPNVKPRRYQLDSISR